MLVCCSVKAHGKTVTVLPSCYFWVMSLDLIMDQISLISCWDAVSDLCWCLVEPQWTKTFEITTLTLYFTFAECKRLLLSFKMTCFITCTQHRSIRKLVRAWSVNLVQRHIHTHTYMYGSWTSQVAHALLFVFPVACFSVEETHGTETVALKQWHRASFISDMLFIGQVSEAQSSVVSCRNHHHCQSAAWRRRCSSVTPMHYLFINAFISRGVTY